MASNNRRFQKFSTLPMEMILEIFHYLGHEDRQAAGGTCRHWYEALCYPTMNRNVMATFNTIELSDRNYRVQSFLASQRPVHAFVLTSIRMDDARTFLHKISTLARWVKFEFLQITTNEFRQLIRKWKDLESLTFSNTVDSKYQYTPGVDLEYENVLANIKELSFYKVDASFYNIVSSIRELKSFRLVDDVRVGFPGFSGNHGGWPLKKNFDLNMVVPHLPYLRELYFSDTAINCSDLVELNKKSEGQLKLEKFCLHTPRTQLKRNLGTFLQTQPNLVYLNLMKTEIKDDCIQIISECLPLLEDLDISLNSEITNSGAVILRNLAMIEQGYELNANEREGFSIERLRDLQKLVLTSCEKITDITLKYGLKLKELRELDLLFCSNITPNGRRWVQQNCRQLRKIFPFRN